MNKQELIDFENHIIEEYKKGETPGPVHLSGGNEEQLLEIFKNIKDDDWVFTNHRSHYHALLKSKDKEWLSKEILSGYSSHINSKKYKIFSSAIVGGCIPIALGVALAIKRKGGRENIFCFLGDMAAHMGCFHESIKYAIGEKLPITFIIEDNNIGCNTPTKEVWKGYDIKHDKKIPHLIVYEYKRNKPHYGIDFANTFIKFKINGKTFNHNGGMY